MFSTCYRSSSLIADSFDDRSRFGQGLSRRRHYLKVPHIDTADKWKHRQISFVFALLLHSLDFSTTWVLQKSYLQLGDLSQWDFTIVDLDR